jgi:hypothetical protein
MKPAPICGAPLDAPILAAAKAEAKRDDGARVDAGSDPAMRNGHQLTSDSISTLQDVATIGRAARERSAASTTMGKQPVSTTSNRPTREARPHTVRKTVRPAKPDLIPYVKPHRIVTTGLGRSFRYRTMHPRSTSLRWTHGLPNSASLTLIKRKTGSQGSLPSQLSRTSSDSRTRTHGWGIAKARQSSAASCR